MTNQHLGRQYTPKPSAQEQILSSAEKSYKDLTVKEMNELIAQVRDKITSYQDKIKEEYYNIWLMQQILKKKSVH